MPSLAYDHSSLRSGTLVSSVTGRVPLDEILGRDDELVVIDELLQPAGPFPIALVIHGDAGIGKTTLWRRALSVARERSYRVLSSTPSEAETSLSFSGVGDLFADELDTVLPRLPTPQARALEVALRRAEPGADPPDQYAIRAALLGALRTLGRKGPVVVAVDDVQWLDRPSSMALAFAVRRLKEDAVALVLALRGPGHVLPLELDRVGPELQVGQLSIGPLSLGALHRLLHARLSASMPRPVLRRVHQASGGNPFFAIELARELDRRGLELRADEPLPLSRNLQQLVRERLSRLTSSTAEVLLAASALSQPTTTLLEPAFGRGRVVSALEEAAGAGVIEVDSQQIRFTHPLLASASYGEASREQRREIHRLVAGVVADVEERARHLALARDDPDEDLASALQQAAEHAENRGAPETAAELADLAMNRTVAGERQKIVQRALQAGDFRLRSGDADGARARFEMALQSASSRRERTDALLRLAQIADDLDDAVALGTRALANADDAAQACRIHQQLAPACFANGRALAALDHARQSLVLAEHIDDESLLTGALTCASEYEYMFGESRSALPLLERALDLEHWPFAPLRWNPRISLARWLVYEGRTQEARRALSALLQAATDRGDEWVRVWILDNFCAVEQDAGELDQAERYMREEVELAQRGGIWHRALLVRKASLDGQLGRVDEARSGAEQSLELGIASKSETVRLESRAVLGLLELSIGNLDAASGFLASLPAEWLDRGYRYPSPFGVWANAIEVLVAVGDRGQAQRHLEQYSALAAEYGIPWQLATAARCGGLVAASAGDFPRAFAAFERALAEHKRRPNPFEEARSLLVYGTALRRAKRRADARKRLDEAMAAFERLSAPLWVEKTRSELARIGGRRREGKLTPTERRVAELVAEGRSNKEVAAAMFVTPKTIETKLSRMYTKLGIHSRAELTRWVLEEQREGIS
jgi:DNA-binding CsgD family transcriptional regulator